MSNKKQYENINRLSTIDLKDTRGKSFTMYLRDLYHAMLPYKVMQGQLSQYQTSAPEQTIYDNSTPIVSIEWTREDVGMYYGTFKDAKGNPITIDYTKAQFFLGEQTASLSYSMSGVATNGLRLEVFTYDETGTPADELLYYSAFELRIFE